MIYNQIKKKSIVKKNILNKYVRVYNYDIKKKINK